MNEFYMEHVESPMFLIDQEGIIKSVASPYQKFLGVELSSLKGHSIFESLPFDYANEIVERLGKVTDKLNCHFLYEIEKKQDSESI